MMSSNRDFPQRFSGPRMTRRGAVFHAGAAWVAAIHNVTAEPHPAEDLAKHPDGLKVGHPITLDVPWFDSFLEDSCEPLLKKVIPRERGWAPEWHYGTLIYIGRKK